MAWPTTPASTTNLDQGSDNPGLARADIQQNILNVNSIINEFGVVDITSPIVGQALVYDGTKWINGDASGTSAAYVSAAFVNAGSGSNGSTAQFTSRINNYGIINSATGSSINLAPGTYTMVISGMINDYETAAELGDGPDYVQSIKLRNTTLNSDIAALEFQQLVNFDGFADRIYALLDAVQFTVTNTANVGITISYLAPGNTNIVVNGNASITIYRVGV